MSSSITFVGIALELESVTQIALATIRVKFTQYPLAANPAGLYDALNPANYTLTGPGIGTIEFCNNVSGDPQSIDLFLTGPLAQGVWTLTASSNISTASGAFIQAPLSMTFNVTGTGILEPVNPGTANDTEEDVIRKHLNAALKGGGWNALIAAIATGEQANRDAAASAFDQLFTSTSSGIYLERRAADTGIERPDNMGLSDETFSKYVIQITNDKLTEESFLEILDVFYGDAALRASNTTGVNAPYALQDGDDLQIVLDGDLTVNCIFHMSDFAQIGQAKAVEVASVITRACRLAGSRAYAEPVPDPQTGNSAVAIYSGSLGLSSSVQVISGKAQNALQFSTLLNPYLNTSYPTWNVTPVPSRGTVQFSTSSANIDLSVLQIGDYVNVYGTEFSAGNKGCFPVTAVSVTYPGGSISQYFEVSNTAATNQSGIAQTAQSDILFFRPTLKKVYSASRTALVSCQPSAVDVILPATSQAVTRQELTGAYAQVNSSTTITSLVRSGSTVTVTAPNHGMPIGQSVNVNIDNVVSSITPPTVTTGNGQTTTSYSAISTSSPTFTTSGTSNHWGAMVTLADGRVLVIGGDVVGTSVGSTQVARLAITGSTSFGTNGTQYTLANTLDTALSTGVNFPGACTLSDPSGGNKVLLVGGTTDGIAAAGTAQTAVYLYTPGSVNNNGSWAATGSLTTARSAFALVQRSDGKVMAIGGYSGSALNSVEAYTPSLKTWAAAGSLNIARIQAEGIQLNTTDVLVVGGRSGSPTKLDYTTVATDITNVLDTCELYNISGNTWTIVGNMTYARVGHKLFLLDNGSVLAIGGVGYNPTQGSTAGYLNSTEIYDPTLKLWTPGPTMNVARAWFGAGRIGNFIYVMGGSETSATIEYLDLTTMKWKISPATYSAGATVKMTSTLTSGLLVCSGGVSGSSFSTANNWSVYVPNNETFMSSDIDGQRLATIVNTNTFTYTTLTSGYTSSSSGAVTQVSATASTVPGPNSYDPSAGVAITGNESTTTQALNKGSQYASVSVADATQFPDAPGYICFAFGFSNQVTPVKYLGRLSNTSLKLDYNYVFPATVQSGAKVTLLYQKNPWVPANPQSVGSFYLTDSAAGRIAAESAISAVEAAGVTVNVSVTYPGDRGLGNEGRPASNNYKVTDAVEVWGSDNVDADLATARGD